MTTVACVWVQGHVPYPREYVTRLAAMVAQHLTRPYTFVCLTDQPAALPAGIVPVRIPSPAGLKGWWSKLELFNPAHALAIAGRVLYLDLDTLIVGPLEDLLDVPAPFALAPHGGTFTGKDGLAVVPRFNSSVMVWDAGACDALYTAWRPAVAARLWGDQDWIGEVWSDAYAMSAPWFPRLSSIGAAGVIPPAARVILAKKPKNLEAAARWPWFASRWGA